MEGYGNENPGAFQPTRPLRGATADACDGSTSHIHFNPRAPCGARPPGIVSGIVNFEHFNPRAPCGARRGVPDPRADARRISTHAPLAGRDRRPRPQVDVEIHFNPRAPCGARQSRCQPDMPAPDFNPRAPCGARPNRVFKPRNSSNISTHAPLAGRDFYE